jgi:HK97 family phage portal protein
MSLWKRTEQRALPTSIDPYQITARPFFNNWSGEVVTEITALAQSAVLSSVTILADSVASMPVELVRKRANRIERLPTPSVFEQPNDHQNMFEFVHQTMLTLALHGTAYIYAPRGADGLPVEMRNIHPHSVKGIVTTDTGEMIYDLGKVQYSSKDVRAIYWAILPNQLRGISPLETMRNTVGMGLAMDRFLAQFYGEGATPSSVLETDQSITPEQAKQIRDNWEEAHYKHRKPAVLQGGLKWRSVTTSAADMQMLEHKESIIRDIARVYRIPLHLILGTGGDSQTYQNIEALGSAFFKYTLLGWVRRLESAFSEMLPYGESIRFNPEEFLRADLGTRVRAQQAQIMSGTLTPNEARQIENREPYEGGDQFVMGIAGAPIAGVVGGDLPTLGTDAIPPERSYRNNEPQSLIINETPQDISINMPQQRVKVDSPIVNLKPQTINIPETVVNVTMPEAKMVRRSVERDSDGRIISITEQRIDD